MSVKMHFLCLHLDYFPANSGNYSDEQGERSHQDLRQMKESYQGYWDINMLADYCWHFKRDLPNSTHRKSLKRHFIILIVGMYLSLKYHHAPHNDIVLDFLKIAFILLTEIGES